MAESQDQSWHILLIDDDNDDYLLTREMLKQAQGQKVELEWASSYHAGEQRLSERVFDAVLVDYDLGPRTGLNLIKKFFDQGYPSPFIMFTGRGSYDTDLEAIQSGATLYLPKNEATPLSFERSIRYAIERKQMERSLAAQQAELSSVFDAQQDAVLIYGIDMNVQRANAAFYEIYGFDPMGLDIKQIIQHVNCRGLDGRPIDLDDQPTPRALKGEKVSGARYLVRRADGSDGAVETSSSPLLINEQVVGTVTVWHDITERLLYEKALQESESRFRELFNSMAEGFALHEIILDEQGVPYDYRFLQANPAFERMTGLKASEILGRTLREVLPEIEPVWVERYGQVALTGVPAHFEQQAQPLGRYYDVHAYQAGPMHFAVIFLDVTERQRADQALRDANDHMQEQAVSLEEQSAELMAQSEDLAAANLTLQERENELMVLMDAVPALISYVDRSYRYGRVNKGYERWFGLTAEQVRGKLAWEVIGRVAFNTVKSYIDRALAGEVVSYEMDIPYREGGTRRVRATMTPYVDLLGRVQGIVSHVVEVKGC